MIADYSDPAAGGTASTIDPMEKRKLSRPPSRVSPLRRQRRQPRKRRPVGVGRLAHRMINQITVINLACFKLRATIKNHAPAVEPDIAQLEKAVQEMHELAEFLSRLEEQIVEFVGAGKPDATTRRIANRSNVYPIAEAKDADR